MDILHPISALPDLRLAHSRIHLSKRCSTERVVIIQQQGQTRNHDGYQQPLLERCQLLFQVLRRSWDTNVDYINQSSARLISSLVSTYLYL